jgi:TRAP-type C4-dicarboxylate transport system substrate-binding protein
VKSKIIAVALTLATILGVSHQATAQPLKLSHNFPEIERDWRHALSVMFAQDLKKAGLDVEVFGNQRLMNARVQWEAMERGDLDFSIGLISDMIQAKEFDVVNMPGLLLDRKSAETFMRSNAAELLDQEAAKRGVRIVGWFPISMAIGTNSTCIDSPVRIRGQTIRAIGAFTTLVAALGGKSANISANEIVPHLETGALDGVSSSIHVMAVSGLAGKIKCVTVAGEGSLGYLLPSIMISSARYNALTPEQRATVREAGLKAGDFGFAKAHEAGEMFNEEFRKAGTQVIPLTKALANEWRSATDRSAIRAYRQIGPSTQPIIDALIAIR